ncbi:MAG: 2,3-bisphosphoglycerate-independent phosphoglycerate mutase [Candidatus Gracilibacteria bacterium]
MKKVLLVILDGFGYDKSGRKTAKKVGNAIELANMKFEKSLRRKYPTTILKCHGEAVGLPKNSMGGSEVGHFTIGAGRVVFQSLEHINRDIKNGSFFRNPALIKAVSNAKKHSSALHLVGMISDEGVHSHMKHLFACLQLAKRHGLNKVFIHAITDGRDVPERSAAKYIEQIQKQKGSIATIVGRYYAMDRDTNWDRTEEAYKLMVEGKGFQESDPVTAIENAYKRGDETDYYIKPIILNPNGLIKKNDSVIFWNFRTDRAKQLTERIIKGDCIRNQFDNMGRPLRYRPEGVKNITFVAFGDYSKKAEIAFHSPVIKNNLGEILSKNSVHQLRIAETEKYAHVTFFFNSQIKTPYKYEDRIMIPSPKVPSYDQKPEMSAYEVTDKAIAAIEREKYGFIALNYANADLVGHSGNLHATIECCKHLDKCLQELIPQAQKHGYSIILTADHGNADCKKYPDGSENPAHSLNPVLCTLISDKKVKLARGKGLSAIAPTVLKLMGIKRPKEMGKALT